MSASIRFLTSSLFRAGFLLFSWPSRMEKVLYLLKSAEASNSTVTFCANVAVAVSRMKISAFIDATLPYKQKNVRAGMHGRAACLKEPVQVVDALLSPPSEGGAGRADQDCHATENSARPGVVVEEPLL